MRPGRAVDEDPQEVARALVEERVGGAFWAPGRDPWNGQGDPAEQALVEQLREGRAQQIMAQGTPHDPFTGAPMGFVAAARMLGGWRRMIEDNRRTVAIFGIAGWKRETLDALLWDGAGAPYRQTSAGLRAGDRVLAWVARCGGGLGRDLAARGVMPGEVEDGFIRSSGLGANCVPPLSVIVDPVGSYVDPARANGLEAMLARGGFAPDVLARAADLRARLIAEGISKYGAGMVGAALPPKTRRRVLVTGQVEDDRAVLLGGAGCDNRALLARARQAESGAEIIYKPHPDVEAGHRKGAIPDAEILRHADRIEREAPIAGMLDQVDALHVISSLAGFEALLRGVEVITHGQPFYAGWGLTRDLGPPMPRRGRVCSIEEMVAAALILYPRYLDPVTRLPCPVEVVVERMAQGQARIGGPLVRARVAQGRLRRLVSMALSMGPARLYDAAEAGAKP
ncbi:beta-3-deoxy-D-manno-oct-2-ulosonic acid transferase [Novosphingobium sediminicola]|uniref:Capsular polysaccharide export protein n=1 Tax=Novosphingobium sediminicola TaxID=563162 RepID=A0A7W6CEK5_9SPHN|nr:capsular polysaccharide export protein [Novosphingobium sediminicola]